MLMSLSVLRGIVSKAVWRRDIFSDLSFSACNTLPMKFVKALAQNLI